jgi:hypothetical protein
MSLMISGDGGNDYLAGRCIKKSELQAENIHLRITRCTIGVCGREPMAKDEVTRGA